MRPEFAAMFDFARALGCLIPRSLSPRVSNLFRPVAFVGKRAAVSFLAALSMACLCAPGALAGALAQTAHFSSAIRPLGSGFSHPYGLAVDSAGNVFIADSGSGTVKEMVAVNGSVPTNPTIRRFGAGSFKVVFAVAVDAAGNIFVADQGVNLGEGTVKEILAIDGSIPDNPTIKTLASGFNEPMGIAVDAIGNVYVADGSTNFSGTVEEILAVNGSIPSNPTIRTLGSGFLCPSAVAVDAAGNVFVADYHNNVAQEIIAVNGVIPDNPTINTIATGFLYPSAIAVDASGNVFVTDRHNNAVKEIVAVGGSIPSNPTILILANQSPDDIWGGALDASGNFYFTDITTMKVEEIEVAHVDFSKVPVGGPSETLPVTFTFDSAGTLGGWRVLPGVPPVGQTTLEFSDVAPAQGQSAACTASQSYNTGENCTVNVKFSPLYPGVRTGSVQLLNMSGHVIAKALLKGIGVGPQIAFPGNQTVTTLANNFKQGSSVAVDSAGNIFVGDYWNIRVVEIPVGCKDISCQSVLPDSHLALDMFVDGSGNLFVVENDGEIKETPWTGGGYGPASTVVSSQGCVAGAIDANGNIYIVDVHGTVSKAPWTGSGYGTPVTVASGFGFWPTRLAVDSAGDIFVADDSNNAVKEIVAVNGIIPANPTVLTLGSGFNSPQGFALDAAGDLIVADSGHGAVKEIVAVNGIIPANPNILTLGNGFGIPSQVARDGAGNIYVAGSVNDSTIIKEIPLSIPQYTPSEPYVFPTATAMGATDAFDGPLSIVIANSGNADLHFPGLTSGLNPSVSANFAWDNQSTCTQTSSGSQTPFTLAEGGICTVAVDFTPVASGVVGPVQGQVTLTDDSLNASSPGFATQTIGVSGMAINATEISASNVSATYSPSSFSVTLSASVSSPSVAVNEGTVAFGVFNGSGPLCLAMSGTVSAGAASASCTVPSGTGVGSYIIEAVYGDPGGNFAESYDISHSLNINKATATVTLAGLAQTYTGTPRVVTASSSPSDLLLSFTYNGSSAAPTSAGSYTVVATVNDANYQGTATGTLVIGAATLTVTANNASKVYGTANPNFTGEITGAVSSDTFAESFTTTATTSSPVGAYLIVPSATGANLANYTPVIENGTLTVIKAGSTTSLSFSSSSITPGQSVTLSAQVSSATTGTPTGTVSFYDNGTLLDTVAISTGSASYSTTTLAASATHTITATYNGDANFNASSASASANTITVAPLDFTMNITGPSNLTVVPGGSVAYQMTVTPMYGSYAGTVSFIVTGLPPGATATVSPSSIAADGGTQTITITIQTAPLTARGDWTPKHTAQRMAPFALALLLLAGAGRLRRRGRALSRMLPVWLLAAAAALTALTGCGGASGFFGKAPQNYIVTATATSGTLQHSASFTLNLQ